MGTESMILMKCKTCSTWFSTAGLKNGKRDLKGGGASLAVQKHCTRSLRAPAWR